MTVHLSSTPTVVGVFLVMTLTGLLLARTAPSYGTALLTVHKLAALLVVVALVLRAHAAHAGAGLAPTAGSVLVAAGVVLLTAIATGGVLSAMDGPPAAVLIAHQVAPFLAVAATVAVIALLPAPTR